jgi:hypothetical protein
MTFPLTTHTFSSVLRSRHASFAVHRPTRSLPADIASVPGTRRRVDDFDQRSCELFSRLQARSALTSHPSPRAGTAIQACVTVAATSQQPLVPAPTF